MFSAQLDAWLNGAWHQLLVLLHLLREERHILVMLHMKHHRLDLRIRHLRWLAHRVHYWAQNLDTMPMSQFSKAYAWAQAHGFKYQR